VHRRDWPCTPQPPGQSSFSDLKEPSSRGRGRVGRGCPLRGRLPQWQPARRQPDRPGTTSLRFGRSRRACDWPRASQPTADQSSPGQRRQVIAAASFVLAHLVRRSEWLTATAAANPLGAVNHSWCHNRPPMLTSVVPDRSA